MVRYVLLAIVLLTTPPRKVAAEQEQNVYYVWDSVCINSLSKGKDTRIEAPAKEDGEPDLTKAVIVGEVAADFKMKCGRVEIRRNQE